MYITRRRTRLTSFLLGLRQHGIDQLVPIVREKRYPKLMRIAALRWLVGVAPLELTQGATDCSRRRYVRRYYGV
jgi:hypothetical protein